MSRLCANCINACTLRSKGSSAHKLSKIRTSVKKLQFFKASPMGFMSTFAFFPCSLSTGRCESCDILTSNTLYSFITQTASDNMLIQRVLILLMFLNPSASFTNSKCRFGECAKKAYNDVNISLILSTIGRPLKV
ncbi:hypothetical protein KC19_VG086500 [Ceratodon purpureus]|uniref:Uncharacterized protein n=1 Tax=Ceratodon purpureus TaxID=3225 RepID=A0A8T0HNF5_CERPU|nr:hypothetical protein KC19_VG086500 [Ceratodon purpureus]